MKLKINRIVIKIKNMSNKLIERSNPAPQGGRGERESVSMGGHRAGNSMV